MFTRLLAVLLVAVLALAGCSADDDGAHPSSASSSSVWDSSALHEFSVDLDEDDFAAAMATYTDSGDKEWLTADVTIDGKTYRDAGLRLKGNSSLRGAGADSEPTELPWLIRLDKFVDGQAHEGWTEFVVRSNSSQTALNEAVALDLLREAGLASEQAVAASFSVNGADARLRLIVQHLDEAWEAASFDGDGWLYKSEAEGDWSYRGDDPDSYVDVFDQETGEENLTPLIEFLDFLNNSSDADFAEQLPDWLDVDAFATYLAFQELVDNFDDIDGPGNNSYLRWSADDEQFTVVNWDLNLAFGGSPGPMGGGRPGGFGAPSGEDGQRPTPPDGMTPPNGMTPPEGFDPDRLPEDLPDGAQRPERDAGRPGGGRPGAGRGGNILAERFNADADFAALVTAAKQRLTADLVDSGRAEEILDARVTTLTEHAGDLIDSAVVTKEADAIRERL